MARSTRKMLDFALVSLKTIRPVVSKAWGSTKGFIMETPVKPLVCNRGVDKLESLVDRMASRLYYNLETLRDKQLPEEAKYLEQELFEVKRKIDCISKNLHYAGATSWKYLKVEAVPPFTYNFFNGAPGRKLESIVGNLTNRVIRGIENQIKEIDAEAERTRLEIEAAIKAREEKAKADAIKKEAERVKEAKKAAEAIKKAKAEAAQRQAELEAAKAKEKPKEKPKKRGKRGERGRKGRRQPKRGRGRDKKK
ncbi:hypothetical protein HF086_002855 [Spodoptera exigua]|uniref:Uncharacterized protein n=1 Tax=Spodoptera exigua TaxID=7107 RepID=A0A922MMT0_SPOEX|nr:hypothetical protein HF086_002855 [Spodoptera exigua]